MATRKKKEEIVVETYSESLGAMLGMEETIPEVIKEFKAVKLSPFDFMTAISFSKEQIITDEVTEGQYNPWIVNNGLSMSQDAVMWTNICNCRPHLPKKAQFLFLLSTMPKRKRYDKWTKFSEIENLEMVMAYYGYSRNKGLSALKLLSEDSLEKIKKKMGEGGTM